MFRIVINTLLQSGGLILFFSMMLFGFNRQFVSANPIILDQIYHTGTSEIFTYDEIESSVLSEVGLTGGLSRVLSKEKVGSDGEVLGAVASVAARGVSVIGPRATYREFAKKMGANFLNVTDDAWTMRKNVKFLQDVVKRGDDVIFAGKYNPAKLDPSSVLAQEIRYLQRHGYSWNKDFTRLIKQ